MINKKAYTEVYFIISQLSDEMKEKIPAEIKKRIALNLDKDYMLYLQDNDLENIELLEDTEKILSVLYTDYLSSPEERKVILEKEKLLKMKKEIKKKREYKQEAMFSEKKEETYKIDKRKQDLIKLEKKNIFQKISEKIKSFFKIFFE